MKIKYIIAITVAAFMLMMVAGTNRAQESASSVTTTTFHSKADLGAGLFAMATMTLSDNHDGTSDCRVSIVIEPVPSSRPIVRGASPRAIFPDRTEVLNGSCSIFDNTIAALERLKPWVHKNEANKTK